MNIFCQNDKLNISKVYLKPGLVFGGSCLPKELRAFNQIAKMNNLDLPLISHIK